MCNAVSPQDLLSGLQSHYLKGGLKRGFVTLAGQYLINTVTLSVLENCTCESQCGTFSLHLMVQQMILSMQVHCHMSTSTFSGVILSADVMTNI